MESRTVLYMILFATLVLLAGAMARAWMKTRDPIHPLMFLVPLFAAGFVYDPWRQIRHPDLELFFPGLEYLWMVLVLQGLGAFAFCLGVLSVKTPAILKTKRNANIDAELNPLEKRRLKSLAIVLGALSLFSYWYGIHNVGGFVEAYSRHKGGGRTGSGWVNELQLLSYPAVIVYALSQQGKRIGPKQLLVMLILISPTLFHGTLGGRRGPLFLSLSVVFFGWFLARARLPKVSTTAVAVGLILVAVVFIQSQRRHLHFGGEGVIDVDSFQSVLVQSDLGPGDNFPTSAAVFIAHYKSGYYDWGRKYVIEFFVRPIPRQLWRTQHNDARMFLYGTVEPGSIRNEIIIDMLGWRPVSGFAINSVVDAFSVFSWFAILFMALLGRMFGIFWAKFRVEHGYWSIVYISASVLSIYLATQSLSAFLHRFFFIVVVTWIFWRWRMKRIKRRGSKTRARNRYPSSRQPGAMPLPASKNV